MPSHPAPPYQTALPSRGEAASSKGHDVPQDVNEGAKWFRKSAEQGFAKAQYDLGVCYTEGLGVAQDYGLAAAWYLKAAKQEHAGAQYNLGVFHERGQHYPQDYSEAANWYRKSAEQGNGNAQNALGRFHEDGLGVPRNLAEAAMWYSMAATEGHDAAKSNLEAMPAPGLAKWMWPTGTSTKFVRRPPPSFYGRSPGRSPFPAPAAHPRVNGAYQQALEAGRAAEDGYLGQQAERGILW